MLLTSADTKSPPKHEEISTSDVGENNTPSELSSAGDEITRTSAGLSPPSNSMGSSPAEAPASARAETSSDEPLTQLSVSAEENSAFKDYIDAQQTDEDDDGEQRTNHVADDNDVEIEHDNHSTATTTAAAAAAAATTTVELRLLVRRREAGALIGKKGANIKRLRDTFRSSMFSIPDTGNGPERVVCINSDPQSIDPILVDITRLLVEKSPQNDEQVELKLLIHSSHAGSIIGIGGQSIKRLRNESKAAIKIYEMCCPLSNERVCAIKARPSIVVSTIGLIQSILRENPIKGTIKPYDALHFDLSLIDKYGGYLPEEPLDLFAAASSGHPFAAYESACHSQKHFNNPGWRPTFDQCDPCEMHVSEGSPAFQQKRDQQQQAAAHKSAPDHSQDGGGARSNFVAQRRHPANRSAGSRFHPYAVGGANCHSSPHQNHHRASQSSRYPSPSGALNYPSAFPASAAAALIAAATAAAAAGHRHPSPRASPYEQLTGAANRHHHHHHHQQQQQHFGGPRASNHISAGGARMVANQFLYPNGGGSGCRHLRPCLCMFMPPPMHDDGGHHHNHHQSATAAMLAAYAQMGPLEASEEFNSQFHAQATTANDHHHHQQQQQRKEATGAGAGSNKNK